MRRDAAGRIGSRRLRHTVVWWLRIIFIATVPAVIVAFVSTTAELDFPALVG